MNVLVVVAHADDEALGVGGTIARHVEAGDAVEVITVADCRTVRRGGEPGVSDELLESLRRLGVEKHHFMGYPGLSLKVDLKLNREMYDLVKDRDPEIVYTHHPGDINHDHVAVAEAVKVACRPIATPPQQLLFFETPSSSEYGSVFEPNVFVELTEPQLETKVHALAAYASEMRGYPHPRSTKGLLSRARYWGQIAGLHLAEPFVLHREIRRGSE